MSRNKTIPEPWSSITTEFGGLAPLGAYLGVSVSTIHRWAHRKTEPNRVTKDALDKLFVTYNLTPPEW